MKSITVPGMDIRPYGWDSLLLEVDDPAGWFQALTRKRAGGELVCEEIVPAAETVMLRGVSRTPDFGSVEIGPTPEGAVEVVIPVRWDGVDLEDVGRMWDKDPPTVMRETRFTVAFCGFAPGFAYLTGLPFPVPRLDSPRTKVPKGSVAVAGLYAGIYPRSSPGGWRLLGTSDIDLFNLERDRPALLEPGTSVRFVDA